MTEQPERREQPSIPTGVVVLPGTPLDRAWEAFEMFEAHHHLMDIMNPLTSADLDVVLEALKVGPGDRVLDIGSGHGEALLRIARTQPMQGVGVDLSPWQIVRAAERTASGDLRGSITWWLGRGEDVPEQRDWDVVLCLGASWIWDGFEGTARAMALRAAPGGRIAIGDVRVRAGVDPGDVAAAFGDVLTAAQQRSILEQIGIGDVVEVVASPGAWDAYQSRLADSANAYVTMHPSPRAEEFRAAQQGWAMEHGGVAELINWTVWVGTVGA